MAHTKEKRRRSRKKQKPFDRDHINASITVLRMFIADRAKNRGEAAMILGAVLADALRVGVKDPARREELLAQVTEMIRKLWAKDDAEDAKANVPVM